MDPLDAVWDGESGVESVEGVVDWWAVAAVVVSLLAFLWVVVLLMVLVLVVVEEDLPGWVSEHWWRMFRVHQTSNQSRARRFALYHQWGRLEALRVLLLALWLWLGLTVVVPGYSKQVQQDLEMGRCHQHQDLVAGASVVLFWKCWSSQTALELASLSRSARYRCAPQKNL